MSKYIDAEKLKNILSDRYTEITVPIITDEGGIESYYRRVELHHIIKLIDSIQQEQLSLPSNLDEAAKEYDEAESWSYEALPHPRRTAFKAGAGFAVQRIISLIKSRIAEILGDAKPAPVLRAELRELIDKIKEESK